MAGFNILNKPFSSQNSLVINLIWTLSIVTVGAWLISFIPGGEFIINALQFNPTLPIYYSIHSYLSSLFLHSTLGHLLGNLLWLYFVGSILEDLIGRKHILWLFFGGGISGVVLYQICASMFGLTTPLIGASAGISAIVLATAMFAPNYRVFLFGIIEVELRWIVLVKILFDVFGLLFAYNFGGNLAHIGGYFFGLAYISEIKGLWNMPKMNLTKSKSAPKRSAKVQINSNHPSQAEIDTILDKISKSGYDSLTKSEKQTLFTYSNKKD